MNHLLKNACLEWRDGDVPIATYFDDPYFSLCDGLQETRHVFLLGNNLPARFEPDFHIAELGFGSGLNFLAAWQAWRETSQRGQLYFTSFEAYPMLPDDRVRALRSWPELSELSQILIDKLRLQPTGFETDDVCFQLIAGDARQTLPSWDGMADAWFLDGFSPMKNPQLWEPDLMRAVGQHTKKNGSFATYTAAGQVRRDLTAAGFAVKRTKGFSRKRHMSIGIKLCL